MQLTKDLLFLNKTSNKLKEKVTFFENKNINFCKFLEENDLKKLRGYLDSDNLFDLKFFTTDEINKLGDSLGDSLSDIIYSMNYTLTREKSLRNQDLIDLLAEYWIYHKTPWTQIRFIYFACSKKTNKSLEYAKNLYENMIFLHPEKSDWIMGALYHKDDIYFDNFFEIHKNNDNSNNTISPITISYFLNKNEQIACYNFKSWTKYYNHYFDKAINQELKKLNDNRLFQYNKTIVINNIFSSLYKTFEGKNAIEFTNFLDLECKKILGLENTDFIKVSLRLNEKKDFIIKEKRRLLTSNRKRLKYSANEKTYEHNLILSITHAIGNNQPAKCKEAFTLIGLDKSYYDHLSQYINLSDKLNNKDTRKEKNQKI